MLLPLNRSSEASLCNSPENLINQPPCRSGHLSVQNLPAGNQATVKRLRKRLADEVGLDRAGRYQIENGSQWPDKLETLRGLNVDFR